MECESKVMKDIWNETAGFYQKLGICKISEKTCQGGEEICSMFKGNGKPAEKKEEKMPEDEEHGEEEAGKEVKPEDLASPPA